MIGQCHLTYLVHSINVSEVVKSAYFMGHQLQPIIFKVHA